MTFSAVLTAAGLLCLAHRSEGVGCFSCAEYSVTGTVLSAADVKSYVVDYQTWSVLTGVVNETCSQSSVKECPGSNDRCISSNVRLSMDSDDLGTMNIYTCGAAWMEKTFCAKTADALSGVEISTDCSYVSCSDLSNCNLPATVLEYIPEIVTENEEEEEEVENATEEDIVPELEEDEDENATDIGESIENETIDGSSGSDNSPNNAAEPEEELDEDEENNIENSVDEMKSTSLQNEEEDSSDNSTALLQQSMTILLLLQAALHL